MIPGLHHGHLKLPRQQQDGAHAQQQFGGKTHPGRLLAAKRPFQRAALDKALKPRLMTSIQQQIHSVITDRQDRAQFDHGLEGHGQDHALVALAGVQLAGAEQDGEQGHAGRHDQRHMLGDKARPGPLGPAEQGIRGGHRLQLQGDIRQRARHGDQRDQRRDGPALAVAAGEKIGDGGDAALLAEPDHAARQRIAEHKHQQRPQIDGQIIQPVHRGRAHGAVKRPR